MLGNNNYVDLTGQMEEVFDSKIQQIPLITEDNLKDKIEEAVAEIEIKPELFDDIYAKIDHSHTSFTNNVEINGDLNVASKINNNNAALDIQGSSNMVRMDLIDTNGSASNATMIIGVDYELNKAANFRYFNTDNPYLGIGFYNNDNILKIGSDKKVDINGELYVKGVKFDGSSGLPSNLTLDSLASNSIRLTQPKKSGALELFQSNIGQLVVYDENLKTSKILYDISETITHKTDEINGEIGTFCETNGGIYTGYDEITETNCICQVQQSNTLNSRIVGIITDKDQFASHGDVLVKIVPGTYHLGDILCPDITGKARIATETELQYMMLHAIPRPKITSLDTKIEGTVACFIV